MLKSILGLRHVVATIASISALFLAMTTAAICEDAFPFLKPDAIQAAYAKEKLKWSDAPDLVLNTFVTAEDRSFYKRSAGRSTLTASISFWYPEPRAGYSSAIAIAIGRALSREEILDWYVHRIFLGQGCFGVDGAAQAYFGKTTDRLELHEAALLAALVRAPARFHPVRAHDRTLSRRNFIVTEMAEAGFISAQQAKTSIAKPLLVRDPLGRCRTSD